MVLVPDFEREPGPKCLAQQTLNSSPVAERIYVGGHHDPRGAVRGGEGCSVLSSDALKQTLAGVARIDLDEIRRRLARATSMSAKTPSPSATSCLIRMASGGTPSSRWWKRR
jgi:hypothetical protein